MTDLVIGASGQIGGHLLAVLAAQGRPAVGACHSHALPGLLPLDLRDAAAVAELVRRVRPAVIYLPAANGNAELCEQHPEVVYPVNVLGVYHIIQAANACSARIVYFSTDYVFDGLSGPYREVDPINPLSQYGRFKAYAEHALALHAPNALIVRTTVVYGWERVGKNFVQRLVHTLRRGERLRVPHDQIGSPTYAPDLARAVIELAGQGASGLYHLAGPTLVDRYTFACAAAAAFGLDAGLIEPVSTAALGQIAPRPLQAGLVSERANRLLSAPLLDYQAGLQHMAASEPGR